MEFQMKLKSSIFALAAVLAVGLLGVPVVMADNFGGQGNAGPPEKPPEPPPCLKQDCECGGSNGGGNGANGRTSEPISYFNGSESLVLTDLVVQGEFPIRVVRKYDSQTR